MNERPSSFSRPRAATVLIAAGALLIAAPPRAGAQGAGGPPNAQPPAGDRQLAGQIEELRAQVARLQQALDQQSRSGMQPSTPVPGQPSMQMGGMENKPRTGMPMGGMGNMEGGHQMEGEGMQGMSDGGMGMDMMDMEGEMGMPPDDMKMKGGMMMDDEMGGMSSGGQAMAPGNAPSAPPSSMAADAGMNMGGTPAASATPATPRSKSAVAGVPGTSHLYHAGSTGFFLDQARITLSDEQRHGLGAIKERAIAERANARQRIERAEQQLWELTGADRPDSAKIQTKAREIERLRTNERVAFIQSVAKASKLLTAQQRNELLGTAKAPAHQGH